MPRLGVASRDEQAYSVRHMITIPSLYGPTRQNSLRDKKKVAQGDSGFSDYIQDTSDTPNCAPVASIAAASHSNPLLSIQEISDEQLAHKRAIRHSHDMLDQLDDIRLALMTGGVPMNMLREIDDLVAQQREQITDPELADLIDEIEVRAAVERAKLEMALQRSE